MIWSRQLASNGEIEFDDKIAISKILEVIDRIKKTERFYTFDGAHACAYHIVRPPKEEFMPIYGQSGDKQYLSKQSYGVYCNQIREYNPLPSLVINCIPNNRTMCLRCFKSYYHRAHYPYPYDLGTVVSRLSRRPKENRLWLREKFRSQGLSLLF
jgi:hypothetical protein